jgi:hypothetical protein
MTATADLPFKFKFVKNGRTQSLFPKKGTATQDSIVLGKDVLSYDDIVDTTTRDQRIVLALSSTNHLSSSLQKSLAGGSAIVLEVSGVKAKDLEKQVDRIASQKAIDQRKQHLLEIGQGHLLRVVSCSDCEATIDLTDYERSAHIYCRFCESIFKENQPPLAQGSTYRICDECGLFDRIRGYTEFYFFFFVVAYAFSYKRRYVCDHCANGLFWKTFLTNLIFILGIPASIYIKIKLMSGRDPALKELARANAFAKKGQYDKAAPIYSQLSQNYLEHPGLLMNEGIGHLVAKDSAGAVQCWQRSLQSCSNYHPTLRLLYSLQNPNQNS